MIPENHMEAAVVAVLAKTDGDSSVERGTKKSTELLHFHMFHFYSLLPLTRASETVKADSSQVSVK